MATPYTVMKFTNISSKDFSHPYHGQPISVRAGESLLLPAEVADHIATHLARRILLDKAEAGRLAKDEPLWSDTVVEKLKAQILAEAYVKEPVGVPSEQQRVAKEIEELNAAEPGAITPAEAAAPDTYKDKQAVLDEYAALTFPMDPRKSKAVLIKELADAKANMATVSPTPIEELTPSLS